MLILLPAPVRAQVSQASERRVVDRAERLRQSGRPDDARAELVELLSRAPASADALALLYDLSLEAGDPSGFVPFAEAADLAAGSSAPRIRDLWVRGLIEAGLADSARAVAQRWMEEAPGEESAVLARASSEVAVADTSEAIDVLREAVERGWGTRAVQLMRADLLLKAGRLDDVVDVWVALLSTDDPALDETAEDVRESTDPADALERLVDALDSPGVGASAGALLAIRLGHAEQGRRLAVQVVEDERAQFLREYVREADLAGQPTEVAWAAGELVLLSPRPVDRQRWRAMVADRSLAAGDTATARNAFGALAEEAEPGTGPHDAAMRRLFGLLAADPTRLGEAVQLMGRYAQEYPDSLAARAGMYGALAEGRARAGDLEAGEATLGEGRDVLSAAGGAGSMGPLDAAGGRLAFWGGARDSAIARTGRSLSQPGLPAAERTARIQLLTAVQAADSSEVVLVGAAAYGFHRDPGGYDVSEVLRGLAGVPQSQGRAAALTYLGGVASRADRPEVATGLWRRVVQAHPASAEAPAAILALAREAERDVALQWLEQLIVGYPESALAPVARRLLAELNEGDIGG